jgi:uncharacterized protein YndB with AHSA1/START domain
MTLDVTIAPVRKSVHVRAPIALAFDVFTSGLTRWWPANVNISRKPIRTIMMEPGVGGRWLEIAEDGTQTCVATIIVWEPPHRVALLWQVNVEFRPDPTMRSEVDIRFTADGPDKTHVELVHHKFETMGADAGARLRNAVDGGWPGLMDRYAAAVERGQATDAT